MSSLGVRLAYGSRGGASVLAACAVIAALAASLSLSDEAVAAASKRCGTIVITSEETLNRVTVRARGVSCRYARQFLLRQKRRGVTPRGWRCSAAGVELYCRRGAQRISHGPPFETIGPAHARQVGIRDSLNRAETTRGTR